MRLVWTPEPFDHPDFVFEPQIDGFRALAYVRGDRCELISQNSSVFKSWPQLTDDIAHAVRADEAVLDGEICCLEPDGRSYFNNLLLPRARPYFYAFDVLTLDGQDLRAFPLLERKQRLLGIIPTSDTRLLFMNHIAGRGRDLYDEACRRDLEGIVGKWAPGTYHVDGSVTSWVKIKNPEYSQRAGRRELFDARRARSRRTRAAPGLRLI